MIYLAKYEYRSYDSSYTEVLKAFKSKNDAEAFIRELTLKTEADNLIYTNARKQLNNLYSTWNKAIIDLLPDRHDKNYDEKYKKVEPEIDDLNSKYHQLRKSLQKSLDEIVFVDLERGSFEIDEIEYVE